MKNCRKILSLVLAAAMTFNCGITANAEEAVHNAYVSAYEASAKKGLKTPSESFLNKVYDKSKDSDAAVICMDKTGKYSMGNYDELVKMTELEYYYEIAELMLSEDYYKEYYSDYFESYSEYKAYILEGFEELGIREYFDNNGKPKKQQEKNRLFIVVDNQKNTEKSKYTGKEIYSVAVDGLIDYINDNTEIYNSIVKALKSGKSYYVSVSTNMGDDGLLDVSFMFTSDIDGKIEFSYSGKLSMSGEEGFMLGNTFVPYSTTSLFISSRDETVAEMLANDFVPESCLKVCADSDSYYNDEITFDIKKLYEKLPNLKELYMYQAVCTNTKYISKFKNLEVLSYYTGYYGESAVDTPFVNLPKLKTLRLYGAYKSYSFLNKMENLKDIHVDVISDDKKVLKSLYKCKNVTSVTIDTAVNDLTGISSMTKLKRLEIKRTNKLDFEAIGKLKNLTELEVRASQQTNIDKLANLKKLKVLYLSDVDCYDWSFLQKMTSLRDLTLQDVRVYNSDIKPLKNLTDLAFYNVPVTYSVLSEFPKLKNVFISDISGSIDSFKGSDSLESYGELFGHGGDYSVLAKCPKLKNISLMGCKDSIDVSKFTKHKLKEFSANGTKVKNAASLAKIKTLEFISLDTENVDQKTADKIKKALPKCNVVYSDKAFHNTI
ncbi:MAG: hypothetical protein IJ446_11345 [Oscillospiraceae bacterium]|nr:hypothetical protein [Oscillospiraceae bacterium]